MRPLAPISRSRAEGHAPGLTAPIFERGADYGRLQQIVVRLARQGVVDGSQRSEGTGPDLHPGGPLEVDRQIGRFLDRLAGGQIAVMRED